MRAGLRPSLTRGADVPLLPLLDVFILYEDWTTGLRAKHSLDLLPEQTFANTRRRTSLWRLELLSEHLLSEQAALEAAAADVIILSFHGRGELPAQVRAWLNRWLACKEPRPYALALLLDSGEVSQDAENPLLACVRQVAAAAGADLFYGFSEAPASELDVVMQEIDQRAHRSSSVLEDMLRRVEPHRCWGINE